MRSQNRKVNNVGKAGCLGLLALGLALANPVSSAGSAFAEEDATGGEVTPLADVPSTVGISFSPAKYYAELSPTDNVGQSARIDLQTTIYVYNSGGYSVYLKSDSPNLVGEKNNANFIPGATTAKTYGEMDVNTWGYAWEADAAAVPNTATYKAVAASGNGDKLAENTSDDIEVDTKTIALSFATKINDQKPADTYSNTMMLSVVSSPAQAVIPWDEMTTMQQMTSKACMMATSGASKQLEDVRDGKFYWVSKLADGKCWMTQNLDLDLSTGTKLTSDTSDVPAEGWTPGFTTATKAIAPSEGVEGTVNPNSQTETRSWSLGNYRLTNPTESQSCGYPLEDVAACPGPNATAGLTTNRFTTDGGTTPTSANGDVNAHYLLGNHYQWNAATAGTGNDITSGQATNSICPKGWKLPESNAATAGTFKGLIDAYEIGSDVAKLTSAPLYFVRGGYVHQATGNLFSFAGNVGEYWSSTPNSSDPYAYRLSFYGTGYLNPSNSNYRYYGFSVRCIAR